MRTLKIGSGAKISKDPTMIRISNGDPLGCDVERATRIAKTYNTMPIDRPRNQYLFVFIIFD